MTRTCTCTCTHTHTHCSVVSVHQWLPAMNWRRCLITSSSHFASSQHYSILMRWVFKLTFVYITWNIAFIFAVLYIICIADWSIPCIPYITDQCTCTFQTFLQHSLHSLHCRVKCFMHYYCIPYNAFSPLVTCHCTFHSHTHTHTHTHTLHRAQVHYIFFLEVIPKSESVFRPCSPLLITMATCSGKAGKTCWIVFWHYSQPNSYLNVLLR